MSLRVTRNPYGVRCGNTPYGLGFPEIGIGGKIQVDRCPICGSSTLPTNTSLLNSIGYSVKSGHAYNCHNLQVTFCDECLTGVGGVDIICRVVEASAEQRKIVQHDCDSLLNARRDKRNHTVTVWGVGISIAAAITGICCLIWKPQEVFSVVGVIALLAVVGCLQGGVRR